MTKTKLTSYKRRVVKLIGWKVAWKEGTCGHFASAMTKFGWKNTRFNNELKIVAVVLFEQPNLNRNLNGRTSLLFSSSS